MQALFLTAIAASLLGAGMPVAMAESIQSIPLVTTVHYDPRQEQGREFSEFTTGIGISLFGGIYANNSLDIKKDIYTKLSSGTMAGYFPNDRERQQIASQIDQEVRSKYFSGGLSNERANAAIQYAASTLSTIVIDRAMEKEGVSDPARRKLWSNRMLQPFQDCMRNARTYKEGTKCLEAFQANSVSNIGLAMSYEMVRQEMGEIYAKDKPAAYRKCLAVERPGAEARVRPCVLAGVRSAAFDYGKAKVSEAARKQVPGAVDAVVEVVSPAFKTCLAKAAGKDGFSKCGDDFSIQAGSEIAYQAVLQNPQVKRSVAAEADRKKIAADGKKAFLACATDAQRANKRDKDGMVEIEACGNVVRMAAAKAVALEVLKQNIARTSQAPAAEQAKMQGEVQGVLNACWKNELPEQKNSDCLKTAVLRLVDTLAGARLTKELPAGLLEKQPKIKEELLQVAQTCLIGKLSGNLLQAEDTDKKVDVCASELTKSAALKIASFQILDTVRGKTTDPLVAPRLEKELVQVKFASCLGDAPSTAQITNCSLSLTKDAGLEVAKVLFTEEFNKFVKKSGGLAAYELNETKRDAYLNNLFGSHDECLRSSVKGDASAAAKALDDCFKKSIRSLATYLGGLELARELKIHVPDPVSLGEMQTAFRKDFGICLDEKKEGKFTITDYVAQIDTCSIRLRNVFTSKVARREINAAILDIIPETSGPKAEKRSKLERDLIATLDNCLEKPFEVSADPRAYCTDYLKKDATRVLVIEGARRQAAEVLNSGDAPIAEISGFEANFEACVQKKKDPDGCGKLHIVNVAKAVGHLKLTHLMADMLGNEYTNRNSEIVALEKSLNACLDAIPSTKIDAELRSKVNDCSKDTEARGVAFSQEYLKERLLKPGQNAIQRKVASDLAEIIPCLNGVTPQKPFDERFMWFFDPEGTFDIMAKLAGDYINYDAEKAGDDYLSVIKKLVIDLEAAGPLEARKRLLTSITQRGMVDQLLKSMIRAEIKKSLDNLPAGEQLPAEIKAKLLDRATLDKIMSPEMMARFRPFMAEKILSPVLIDGKSMKAGPQAAAISVLKTQIADALLESKDFGDVLVTGALQQQIDKKASNGVTKWLATKFLGYSTLYWDQVRSSPKGKAAEEYLRNQVLKPQFLGLPLTAEERVARTREASRLVEEALKK